MIPPAFDPSKEELTTIVPDSREAYGPGYEHGSVVKGASTTTDIKKAALAQIYFRFEDKLVTCELYKAGDEFLLHMICPRCYGGGQGFASQVSSRRKAFGWNGHHLDVEAFRCTWEADNDVGVSRQQNGHVLIGNNLCNLRIGLVRCGTTPALAGRAVLA